jgi:hypothetical protein
MFLQIALNGFMGLIVIRLILAHYGSDFNGVNTTATQLAGMLMIIEGGISLATNVALIKPLKDGDYYRVNAIMAATSYKFRQNGFVFALLGFFISIVYSYFINSGLEYPLVLSIMIMGICPSAFNLFYSMKYKVILQSQQKEYIVSILTTGTLFSGYLVIIWAIFQDAPMWGVRLIPMVFAFVNCFLVAHFGKKELPLLDLSIAPDFNSIKGSKDVFIGRILNALYETFPVLLLSIMHTNGAILVSIYSVYKGVYSLLKNLLYSVSSAPRFAFGVVLADTDQQKSYRLFLNYQMIIFVLLGIFSSTASVMIIPFVTLYTAGVKDVNYVDWLVATLFTSIMFVEILHVPSGTMINMSGKFKTSKKIQATAFIILLIALIVGIPLGGLYGMLAAVLITSISLAVMEVHTVQQKVFNTSVSKTLQGLAPVLLGLFLSHPISIILLPDLVSYIELGVYMVLVFLVSSFLHIMLQLLLNRKQFTECVAYVNSYCRNTKF